MSESEYLVAETRAHPMPGWIALVRVPEAEDQPCLDCGEVHSKDDEHAEMVRIGPVVLATRGGGEGRTIVRSLVVELGDGGEEALPYGCGAIVYHTSDCGLTIRGTLYMLAGNVIAWEEAPDG